MEKITNSHLRQFSGSCNFYRYGRSFVLTEGVHYLITRCQCHWLVDVVISYQPQFIRDLMLQGIQFWELEKTGDYTGVIRCLRDEDDIVVTQELEYTDFFKYFGDDKVRLYFIPPAYTLMLPSEY
jgi:hypothetical protein